MGYNPSAKSLTMVPLALNMQQTATPSILPNSGYELLYIKSDGKVYTLSPGGVETSVSALDNLGNLDIPGSLVLLNSNGISGQNEEVLMGVSNAILTISGDTSVSSGGIIQLYGSTSGNPNWILFAQGSSTVGWFDSTNNFHISNFMTVGNASLLNGLRLPVAAKTSAYAMTSTDFMVTASGAAFTVTLPNASSAVPNQIYTVKKTDSSPSNIITVGTTAGQTIDGSSTYILNIQNQSVELISDGTNWQILVGYTPASGTSYTVNGVLYANSTNTITTASAGTTGQILTSNGTGTAPNMQTLPGNTSILKPPTVQRFTATGVALYTLPTGPKPLYLRVRMVGAGGGGGGGGNGGAGIGASGTQTVFGLSTCGGGGGGGAQGVPQSPTGGSVTVGSDMTITIRSDIGAQGQAGQAANASGVVILPSSGIGGSSPFGGGGAGQYDGTGIVAVANTGSGGGGGGSVNQSAVFYTGAGGASGGYLEGIITNPQSSYSLSIGTGGTAGIAGSGGGFPGGRGADGFIVVEEYYQ